MGIFRYNADLICRKEQVMSSSTITNNGTGMDIRTGCAVNWSGLAGNGTVSPALSERLSTVPSRHQTT